MKTLGIVMFSVFGLIFAAIGIYLLVDRLRTGELFRQKRLFYVAMGAGLAAIAGVMIYSAN